MISVASWFLLLVIRVDEYLRTTWCRRSPVAVYPKS